MANRDKRLMGQIVRYFLLLSLMTVGVISGVAYWQSRNAIKRSILDGLALTATLKEDELNRWVDDQREEMLAIAHLPQVQSSVATVVNGTEADDAQAAKDYLRELMQAIAERHSSLSEVLVLSPGGQVLLSSRPESEGNFEALVQYSYVPQAAGIEFSPNFYLSPNTQEARMSFAISLEDSDGKSAGLLAMHLDLERIDTIIRQRSGLGETGETYLVGNQGSSLSSYSFFLSGQAAGEVSEGLHSEGIDRAMQGMSGQGIYRNHHGTPVLGVYRWLENRDLALIVEISCHEAFAPARKLARTIILTGVTLVGLSAILVYWGARRISRPILAISNAAERVADGNFNTRARVLTNNEIGLLARVFNQMTEQLRRLYTNLEAEVAERTVELQQANDDLAQAKDAAEVANRAKSQFLANISHELRTPLNAILGFSQLLIRDPAAQPSQREHLEIINRSGEHLLTLINDVLSMSKIEAGLVSLNNSSFDLFALIDSVEHMLWAKADAKGLDLRFERSPDLPQYIYADEGKLRQVLINLLSNAIKFTTAGEVVLRAQLATASPPHALSEKFLTQNGTAIAQDISQRSLCLTFDVSDTGPGIASQDLPHLFQPFIQSSAGQHAPEGTGLGLAISRQFVELMGGQIGVDNTSDKGVTFTFSMQAQRAKPIDLAPARPARRVVGLAPHHPPCRILIVEDRWENRRLLINLLQPLGFDVREAQNGQEAIAQWQTWQPHLIWMDMRMPVIDGYEATRQIRKLERTGQGTRDKGQGGQVSDSRSQPRSITSTPNTQRPAPSPHSPFTHSPTHPSTHSTTIIALTASAFEESRSDVLAAGCDEFVRKPFQESIIFDLMAKYLPIQYCYEATPPSAIDHHGQPLTNGSALLTNGGMKIPSPASLASSLKAMPPIWLSEVQSAATQADSDWLQQLIAQVPQKEEDLTTQLSALTKKYEFDGILDLIKSSKH